MAQAKTLSDQELQRVLDYAATTKAAVRNRAILLLTHWAGMRIGEVASVRYSDVLNADKQVLSEIHLAANQTSQVHRSASTKNNEPSIIPHTKSIGIYAQYADARNQWTISAGGIKWCYQSQRSQRVFNSLE